MTTRARQEEKVPYLIDLKVEDRVRPCTPIAVRKAQGIRKITLKAKIVKEDTRSLNYEGRSPVSKMTISPNLGSKNGKVGHAKCHMFNSTLTGNARVWFDDLPPESIDSYNDLREAFLKNYIQQKKCIRDPIVLHNIKQRDGESTGDFIQRYKSESGNVKGAPELDEMMQVATSFLQGQEATSNQEMKKAPPAWKHQEGGHRQNFKKGGGFRSQHKQEKRLDRFTLLTKTPREILALEKGKFKTPPPMTTPVEKRNANKFCEFHGEIGHNTDDYNHLRRQIEDMLKAGKLSHIIKELKQNSVKDQHKKKGKTSGKEKPQAILMIHSWQKIVRQKISQSFSPNLEISFPSLGYNEGAKDPLITKAEIGGHQVHRMCIDGGSSFEILYEHLRSTSPYNGIIGRPGLRKIHAVPSTMHGMIKLPVTGGILMLRSSKIIPIECAMIPGPEDQPLPPKKAQSRLCNLIQRNLDIFAWTLADMTGVPRHIAEHRLNVREGCQPIRQKKRGQSAERNIAINDEVSKLVAARIIREVHYHDWLSNPVMGTDISQKDEKPSKKRQNRSRDGKVCEGEAQSKSSQLREEKAKKNEKDITPKDRKQSKKMTNPGTEWKSCKGQGQSKAKDQPSQSQSQLNKLTVKTGAEKDITPKDRKQSKKMTNPGTEWKSCKGQGQSKAKDQPSQSQSQLNKLTVKTGAIMAGSTIAISSDSLDESVGSPPSRGPTFTHVADEATTTGVRVGTEGATTTTSGLDAGLDSGNIHESPLRSHDTPLHDVNTSRSVEDSLKLKELSLLVPKLELKIGSLEKELKETKQTFGNAILTLVDRVKSLEVALKRKSKKVILSESEDEETENQGRKIHDIDDDPLVSLVRDFVTPTKTKVSASGEAQEEDISPTTLEAAKTLSKVASQKARSTDKGRRYKRRKMSKGKDIITGLDAEVEVNTGEVEINTGSIKVNTGSIEINTGREKINTGNAPAVVQTVNITIPSPVKGQREGKAPMTTKDVQVTKRTKAQIQQEEAGLAEAMRLQAQMDEEIAKQVHLDEMVAKRVQEEEELTDQQAQRMAQVHEAAQYYTKEDWDNIRAKLEANAELVKDVLGKDMSSKDYAKRMVDMINQKKKYYKLAQLKKLTFEELKTKFEKLVKSIESFMPMGSEERVKRHGIQLEQETSKKQKIAIEDVPEEKAEEDMEAIEKCDSSSSTDILVNPVLIVRENGTNKIYISFGAMLKDISRDDLTELYRLVMQRYGTNRPEDKYERVFWRDLKTMFDPPLSTDLDWNLLGQQKMLSWRYYDTYRVHCLNLESANIYMLTERRYPLPADV
ncbi:reverse transcriptase domain-containing protein [Tanacetum coccineum]